MADYIEPLVMYDVLDPVGISNLEDAVDDDGNTVPDAILVLTSSLEDLETPYPFRWDASYRIPYLVPGIATGAPRIPLMLSLDDTYDCLRDEYEYPERIDPLETSELVPESYTDALNKLIAANNAGRWARRPIDYIAVPLPKRDLDETPAASYERRRRLQLSTLQPVPRNKLSEYPRGYRVQPRSWNADWSFVAAQIIGLQPEDVPNV